MMKWTRTPTGRYVSGDYVLIPVGFRSRREGWAIQYRGESVDSRNSIVEAKRRAERHRAKHGAVVTLADTIAGFPDRFGLRGFPGDVFRCSATDSYVNDSGVVVVYTERLVDGRWYAFAKGSADEVRREMVTL